MAEFPNQALANYVFPNNMHVEWEITIVIYPYITGLIAGAFVVSALYHVFKVKDFQPIAKFALVASFCFGLFAATPLLVHLGQPQRAFNIYFTPHLTSAMSVFGYVYGGYLILLMVEIWLIYRPFFIQRANETEGALSLPWKVLTLGVMTYHPDSARIDHKLATILSGIGIPWAFLLHGYVGFVFGSVKAVAWWATPLQPVIFLLSGMVSGMAILLLMYAVIMWAGRKPVDYPMVRKFCAFLWGIFMVTFALEMLEVLYAAYEQGHHWTIIKPLITGPLYGSYLIGQVMILSFVPLVVLGFVVLAPLRNGAMLALANLSALMICLQVLFMRFNVVIGGQLISKSERGFVDYHFQFFDKEGVLTVTAIFVAPFVVYYILNRFIPIFDEPGPKAEAGE